LQSPIRLLDDMESLRSLGDVCELVAVDRRPTISLNGDWHTIVDPYGTGLYTFHGDLRTDGYFMNGKQAPGGEPVEYDFQRSPVLQVPGDCSKTAKIMW
jgi:beta-glucuronidase